MFEYEMIYEFRDAGGRTRELKKDEPYILLLPEFIGDIKQKIKNKSVKITESDFKQNGIFNNGYCILCAGDKIWRIYRQDGSYIENLPDDICIESDRFYNNRLLVFGDNGYQYIDGKSGDILSLPDEYSECSAGDFFEGKAILSKTEDIVFVDENFKQVSQEHYFHASNFVFGRALVCTEDAWKFVDSDFKEIMSYPRGVNQDLAFLPMIEILNQAAIREASKHKKNVVCEFDSFNNTALYRNVTTGFSIFALQVIKDVADALEITLPEADINYQLVFLVNEAAKRGIYVYDLSVDILASTTIKKGIVVKSSKGRLVSFDSEDVEFLRTRVKKEESNE